MNIAALHIHNYAYDELLRRDPKTSISKAYIRAMIDSGKVPFVQSGNRKLVDVDVLEACVEKLARVEI